ncbi:MAG: histidine kinase N-terminal 7TM domain-containing protein, partial [Spirochaetota bacterium]|nr:histidine kinase N-terminal 7TM domain-containing protein [Spirochaetota bacterium]
MNTYLNILTLPLLISLFITLALIFLTIKQRSKKGAIPFLFSLLAVLIWTGGYIIEIGARGFSTKLFWANIQFIGIGMLPVAWCITSFFLTGRETKYRSFLPFLLPVPVLINILIWADPWIHIIRINPSLIQMGPLLLLDARYGALHNWVFVPFQYIIYGFTLVLFLDAWMNARSLYRRRYLLIGSAILIPMTGSALYIIGISPFEYINPTPALFSIACIIFARAIFSFSMLDVLPLARDAVVENLKDIILVFDAQNRLVDYNPAAEKLFPLIGPNMIGLPAPRVLEDKNTLLQQLLNAGDSSESNFSFTRESDREFHYRSALALVRNRKRQIIGKILTISDITAQVELLKKMQKLATTDSLTGILNRRSFFEQAHTEIDRAKRYRRPVSFILLDIDHFKRINDSYGHAAGDAVLTELSRRITSAIRKEDIFGRYGGEEFSLCLPETNQATAYIFAERLRKIVEEEPVQYTDKRISV